MKWEIDKHSFTNPPIPDGFSYVEGEWNNGIVIQNTETQSEYVWIPVETLENVATLDGVRYDSKFGRSSFGQVTFSQNEYNEELDEQLELQIESVNKYGGFYIGRYKLSYEGKNQILTVKGVPIKNIPYLKAMELAEKAESNSQVTSHLLYGAEYDTMVNWLIQSNAVDIYSVLDFSTIKKWKEKLKEKGLPANTPVQEIELNHIGDIVCSDKEWTQETINFSRKVARGSRFLSNNVYSSIFERIEVLPWNYYYYLGLRVALCIK